MADILSVGIDIGTSTTQVIFSRIAMENTGGYFSVPRVSIVDKQVIYKSKIYITPLKTPVLIDGAAVRDIVAKEYRAAGYAPRRRHGQQGNRSSHLYPYPSRISNGKLSEAHL